MRRNAVPSTAKGIGSNPRSASPIGVAQTAASLSLAASCEKMPALSPAGAPLACRRTCANPDHLKCSGAVPENSWLPPHICANDSKRLAHSPLIFLPISETPFGLPFRAFRFSDLQAQFPEASFGLPFRAFRFSASQAMQYSWHARQNAKSFSSI